MLVVLGPPGSGCTTMLKTLAGDRNGIYLDEGSELNYMGEGIRKHETDSCRYFRRADAHPISGRSNLYGRG